MDQVSGPQFIVIGNNVYGITGACSFPYLYSFELNQALYLNSGSFCCDCGITGMELFKISGDSVSRIKVNYDWSD
jgi:hypothetical protein